MKPILEVQVTKEFTLDPCAWITVYHLTEGDHNGIAARAFADTMHQLEHIRANPAQYGDPVGVRILHRNGLSLRTDWLKSRVVTAQGDYEQLMPPGN